MDHMGCMTDTVANLRAIRKCQLPYITEALKINTEQGLSHVPPSLNETLIAED